MIRGEETRRLWSFDTSCRGKHEARVIVLQRIGTKTQ